MIMDFIMFKAIPKEMPFSFLEITLPKAHLDTQVVIDPLNQRVNSPQNLFTL